MPHLHANLLWLCFGYDRFRFQFPHIHSFSLKVFPTPYFFSSPHFAVLFSDAFRLNMVCCGFGPVQHELGRG